ncbi:polyhydroxyalkanoate synthesis repressor PhaR [Sediminicurvatus halobius]|uniref:Polyhydroxyalkanoate synthesis repressor PhaR n=1 Tax=Sediminicurvatus halobius TaxID=2182432 RepID=A0A2U2MW80_9GAMM|nr:polyhydroxyalkanoate synthesis repressor PhaR [Spiribacter halobius]PWG61046.1 polyhydroxyalkanoate synthesis repressor PhaR [Spiribacter halobius]UEX78652.1 polyhydroxyalkanoate synthesis repressor PhaR [Spiribacter halobius]
MSETRLIKKYPNRRLYDTAISSYITLADVKRLVLDGVDFQVVDAKTRADLTRTILLQIISEEEEGGEPIFSSELLAQIIRAYGGNMQNMLTSYLEKSMELWSEQQRVFRERTRHFMDTNPMQMLTQIAERNLSMWQAMSGLGGEKNGEEDEQGGKDAGSDRETPPESKRSKGESRRRRG